MPRARKNSKDNEDRDRDETWSIDGQEVRVTSLGRTYWPADGLTKGDLLAYYCEVGPVMLPYLSQRPMTFVVHPQGIEERGYYRRARPKTAPDDMRAVRYQPESRERVLHAPLIDDLPDLLWYANRGAIEFHLWLSREDSLEMPDWAVFDLDAGETVPFERVLEAATVVREHLNELDIDALPKTSGGTGLHLFVPLEPTQPFDAVREWIERFTSNLAQQHPDLIGEASGATHTRDVVTIDHAQNSIARNTSAPYTVRARPGAPVSAPLTWDEVGEGTVRPGDFTLKTMPKRLAKQGDLWQSAARQRYRLPDLED